MAGWHHWLDGHESEWTPGVGDGQEGLACCHSWGRKESDTTEQLNWTDAACPIWTRDWCTLHVIINPEPRLMEDAYHDLNNLHSHYSRRKEFWQALYCLLGFPVVLLVNNLHANAGDIKRLEVDPWVGQMPDEGMAAHSSILAWRIPWTEEPDEIKSIGSQRVRHDWDNLALQVRTFSSQKWHTLNLFTFYSTSQITWSFLTVSGQENNTVYA